MARMPGVPFRPPRSWTSGRPGGPPRFVVIHYTAGSEGPTAAEDGVAYDQRRTDGTSAHFYVDRDSVIQCVDTANRSHTAKYYGNLWGIHIELCGTRQSRAQWLDAASRPTIRNAAKVAAWAMQAHGIPLARLVTRQIRTGRGIAGHYDCTHGFTEDRGTHEDPEPNFPWDVLFDDIRAELGDDDMTPEQSRKLDLVTDIIMGGPYKDPTPGEDPARSEVWLIRAIWETQQQVAAGKAEVVEAVKAVPAPVIDYDALAKALLVNVLAPRPPE